MERVQHTNSILNSYLEKAQARDISNAISRGIQKVKEDESRNTADAFVDRNRRLLDKGREAVKREQGKTYLG